MEELFHSEKQNQFTTLIILLLPAPLKENKMPNTSPQKITKAQFSGLGSLAQFRHFCFVYAMIWVRTSQFSKAISLMYLAVLMGLVDVVKTAG